MVYALHFLISVVPFFKPDFYSSSWVRFQKKTQISDLRFSNLIILSFN